MAQAMRALQVPALNGAVTGASQNGVYYASKRVSNTRRSAFALRASMKDDTVAVAVPASIVVLADAGAANALTGEDVTEAYLKVQSAASQVSQAAIATFDGAKNVVNQVARTVKPAVDFVTPYVQQSADYVYKAAIPVAVELEKQAEKAIQSSGYDTKPVLEAAKTAASAAGEVEKYIEGAKPSISSALQNVFSSDPFVMATGAGALLLLYFLVPPLLSSVSYAARGFKGKFSGAILKAVLT